jgi:hypothetical protein
MAYDCCGGKRRHLGGCPFAGSGPTPEKPTRRKRYCDDSWDTANKGHSHHACILEDAHRGAHRCFCGATC